MIKRIKKKYIIVVMSAVIVVLGLIIAAINITNFSSVNSLLNEKVDMLVDNEGLMPELPFGEKPKPEVPEDDPSQEGGEPSDEEGSGENGTEDPGTGDSEGTGDGTVDNTGGDNTDGGNPDGENQGNEDPGKEGTGGEGSDVTEDGTTDKGGDGDGTEDGNDGGNTDGEGTGNGDGTVGGGVEGDGTDVKPGDGEGDDPKDEEEDDDFYQHMSPETPYELRYFSIKLDARGNVLNIDTTKITAVDAIEAADYAKQVFESGKERGFLDSYKYQIGKTDDGNLIYVFLDVDRELQSLKSFMISSLIISAIGILTVFALVVILSETALRPIIESYEKQKRFITDAGHEMKTPLAVISANAEIIEIEGGESQWIDGIKSQVSKLASLTEKLVVLSKMEEGIKLEMIEFSLSEAFYDTCEQYKAIARSGGVRFNLNVDEDVRVIGNEVEIRRCISLLLDNAFRYVNQGGTVDVKVQRLSSGVEFKISNSTDGVEKGSLDRWFDRFYRTDVSRNSDTGGSGIGLSVVKAIVLAHGGSVKARSDDGIKVEFTINL